MAWRAIHDYACQSATLGSLDDLSERLFWRILAQSDAHGRMRGEPKIIHAQCAALTAASVSDIEQALLELREAGLVVLYPDGERVALAIVNFDEHQPNDLLRRRGESRFAEPPLADHSRTSPGALPESSRLEESREEKSKEEEPPLSPPQGRGSTPGVAASVIEILSAIAKPGYGPEKLRADRVEALLEAFLDVDVIGEARALADWEIHGKGATVKTKDGVARLRNWLNRSKPGTAWSLPTDAGGNQPAKSLGEQSPYPQAQSEVELLFDEITLLCSHEPELDFAATYEMTLREALARGDITAEDLEDALLKVAA